MRRLVWIGVGAATAVVVLRKVRGAVERHTPPGVRTAVSAGSGVVAAVRGFVPDLRAAMRERESELRESLLAEAGSRDGAQPGGVPDDGRLSPRPRHRGPGPLDPDEPLYEF